MRPSPLPAPPVAPEPLDDLPLRADFILPGPRRVAWLATEQLALVLRLLAGCDLRRDDREALNDARDCLRGLQLALRDLGTHAPPEQDDHDDE
jgi:hypothetical protein